MNGKHCATGCKSRVAEEVPTTGRSAGTAVSVEFAGKGEDAQMR